MADMIVEEGKYKIAQAADDLIFPSISSCVSITLAFANGIRYGGHAILVPEGASMWTISEMCADLQRQVALPGATRIYVVGDTATWDGVWDQLPQTRGLQRAGVNRIADLARYFGARVRFAATNVINPPVNAVDVTFYSRTARNNAGLLTVINRANGALVGAATRW